jgi:hypothetical protein
MRRTVLAAALLSIATLAACSGASKPTGPDPSGTTGGSSTGGGKGGSTGGGGGGGGGGYEVRHQQPQPKM